MFVLKYYVAGDWIFIYILLVYEITRNARAETQTKEKKKWEKKIKKEESGLVRN